MRGSETTNGMHTVTEMCWAVCQLCCKDSPSNIADLLRAGVRADMFDQMILDQGAEGALRVMVQGSPEMANTIRDVDIRVAVTKVRNQLAAKSLSAVSVSACGNKVMLEVSGSLHCLDKGEATVAAAAAVGGTADKHAQARMHWRKARALLTVQGELRYGDGAIVPGLELLAVRETRDTQHGGHHRLHSFVVETKRGESLYLAAPSTRERSARPLPELRPGLRDARS